MSVANCILWSTCTDEAHTVMCGTSPQGCRVIHPSQTKKSHSQIEIRFLRYVIILGKKTELPLFITMTKSHFFYITEHWWIEETEESFTFFPPSEGQHLAKYFQTADSRYLSVWTVEDSWFYRVCFFKFSRPNVHGLRTWVTVSSPHIAKKMFDFF